MCKYKITVYAICKNEEKYVSTWYESMKEADEIVVLDTGSTDNTVSLLKSYPKVKVYEEQIIPWRFDVARNLSLSKVSPDTDICVCTDLDEVFETNWRSKLEKSWQPSTTRARYLYNWSFDTHGNPGTTFYLNKIHKNHSYHWTHPVHEVLTSQENENEILIEGIVLNHHPDPTKSRHSYLPLLELSVRESPEDDRNMHYLGREYMYYQKWDKCIETLHRHLNLKTATWRDERSASMRYIGYSYYHKKYYDEAIMWYQKSIKEAPYLREPYFDIGYLYYSLGDYQNSEKYLRQALKIKNKTLSYINEERAWNETIYDLLSVACYYNNKLNDSIRFCKKASKINPNDKRIQANLKILSSKINS